jgi:hypothetical protein
MRNFLAFLAAAVIVLAGAGWYLDWFKFSTAPAGNGHQNVTIDMNTDKLGTDVTSAENKVKQIIEKDKSSEDKADTKGGVEVQADNKGVEVKSKNVELILPMKPHK